MSKLEKNWTVGVAIDHDALAVFPEPFENDGRIHPIICLISPLNEITEEDEYNANLIANAPNLLIAMQKTCDILSKLNDTNIKKYYVQLTIQYADNLKLINDVLEPNKDIDNDKN